MLLNQETFKYVFGLKLRGLRLEKELSLKDLAQRSGLSPSYINEIEKGKKYPKPEKIMILAKSLDEKYEDLVSLELKRELQLVQSLIDKKFLTGIPFELFGIPSQTVFELLSERPKKMAALVGTIIEIARAHQIDSDDFYFALLRSYLDLHENFFPHLEKAAEQYRSLNVHPTLNTEQGFIATLNNHGIEVEFCDLKTLTPRFQKLKYVFSFKKRKLWINKDLQIKDRTYILAREVGYQQLKLRNRLKSNLVKNLNSFEELFNHFSASYFASALLVPKQELKKDIESLFSQTSWDEKRFAAVISKYEAPSESVFHRISQLLPHFFGIKSLFFLRYEFDRKRNRFEIARELHIANPEAPHKIKGFETYCRRWLLHRLNSQKKPAPTYGAQVSHFVDTQQSYLILGASEAQHTQNTETVCLGINLNSKTEKTIRWLKDKKLIRADVGTTCERCKLTDCKDRAADTDEQLLNSESRDLALEIEAF